MERVSPTFDPREHACDSKESPESRESNHKIAKARHDLIGYPPSHGHLNEVKEPKSVKGSKTTITWHIQRSIYVLRRMRNWEREGVREALNPPWREETPYFHLAHGIMRTTKLESHHEDTNEPGMDEKCNVSS